MIVQSTQLPTLFPSYDERASQPIGSIQVASVDLIDGKDYAGHGKGGTNYWVNEDPRPTAEEAKEKIDDFRFVNDILDIIVPESVKTNIPRWLRVPYANAPDVADLLIDLDPLDRIQD